MEIIYTIRQTSPRMIYIPVYGIILITMITIANKCADKRDEQTKNCANIVDVLYEKINKSMMQNKRTHDRTILSNQSEVNQSSIDKQYSACKQIADTHNVHIDDEKKQYTTYQKKQQTRQKIYLIVWILTMIISIGIYKLLWRKN